MQEIQEMNRVTIGEMVADNFRTAEVFKKYGIDFCCKGHRLLTDVCNEKQLDIDEIKTELSAKETPDDRYDDTDFSNMPLDALVEHIVAVHHAYITEAIPTLAAYLTKVNKVHGKNHPELNEILMQFLSCADELMLHMHKEETILFPSIKRIWTAELEDRAINTPLFFGSFGGPISHMKEEHATEGERVARMTELSNHFTPPNDACTTYRVAYQKLEEFINDLYTHIHLENNILFPKTLALEQKIIQLN